jgi:hypothetical protein
MWAALASSGSGSSSGRQLQELQLSMPLTRTDEVAIMSCLIRQAPRLQAVDLQYNKPSPQLCFDSAAASGALASATQLHSLRITGAALGCTPYCLRRLTLLTRLEVTTAKQGLAGLLSYLLQLRHLSVTQARLSLQDEGSATTKDQLNMALVSSLAQCSGLTSLQLVGFKADSSSWELLRGLSKLQELQELELAGSLLQARQLLHLAACTALTRLCLASNNLGNIDAAAAADGAPGADDDGSSSGAVVLSQLLPALQQLQELDVSGCRVQLQPVFCLTRLTSLHAGAHRFRFHPNLVTTAGLVGISKLRHELRALDLSCNQLNSNSLQHLSQLVLMTSLNLAENSLGSDGDEASAAADSVDEEHGAAAAVAAAGQAAACPPQASSAADATDLAQQAATEREGRGRDSGVPYGLQHLRRLQQLQRLDLSSCGLQDITPLVCLAGVLLQYALSVYCTWCNSLRRHAWFPECT